MSELERNNELETNNELEMRTLPENECCKDCKPQSEFKPNQCKKNDCCEPKESKCPTDITNAKCIPILTERIYDCICIHHEQTKYYAGPPAVIFTLDATTVTYKNEPICIDLVATNYDFIGLTLPSITPIIDNLPGAPFNQTSPYVCSTETLYNSYRGNITTTYGCCEQYEKKGEKTSIFEQSLQFFVCNLEYVVKGRIGCEDFTARASVPGSAQLSGGRGIFNTVDFYGRICLPNENKTVNIEETFESCLSADCVTPSPVKYTVGSGSFTASMIVSFVCDKNIIATTKEKLIVYTSPDGQLCDKGNFLSNCESDCR